MGIFVNKEFLKGVAFDMLSISKAKQSKAKQSKAKQSKAISV